MINRNRKWESCFTVLVGFILCAMVQVHAQQRGTAGGGRTAGQGRSGSTSGGSREYYGNGEVGDAMIKGLFFAAVIFLVGTFPATWLLMLFLGNVGANVSY